MPVPVEAELPLMIKGPLLTQVENSSSDPRCETKWAQGTAPQVPTTKPHPTTAELLVPFQFLRAPNHQHRALEYSAGTPNTPRPHSWVTEPAYPRTPRWPSHC